MKHTAIFALVALMALLISQIEGRPEPQQFEEIVEMSLQPPVVMDNSDVANKTNGRALLQTTPPTVGVSCNDEDAALNQTNAFRALHGVKPYAWTSYLEGKAQAYADYITSKWGCNSWQHSNDAMTGRLGENLYKISIGGSFNYMGALNSYGCTMAVKAWYGEIGGYKWTSKPWTANSANFGMVGHFTATVWASSTQMGCGQSVASYADGRPMGCKVIVCNYLQAGNMATNSAFLANVKPLLSSKKKM